MEKFAYIVETEKSFQDTVISVLKEIEKKSYTIFQIYDIQERLKSRGFEHKQLKIIEFCSAKYSNSILNKNKSASLFMPCKINIYEEDNKVKIASLNPLFVSEIIPGLGDLKEIEQEIKQILDNSK